MKLWLDDVRKPPDESWTWCKTAKEAFEKSYGVDEVALDHDLGGQLAHYGKGPYDHGAPTGLNYLKWCAEQNWLPTKISIHSTNLGGMIQMLAHLYTESVRMEKPIEITVYPMRGIIMDKTPYYEDR